MAPILIASAGLSRRLAERTRRADANRARANKPERGLFEENAIQIIHVRLNAILITT